MAIDASLIEADANKQNSTPKEDWDVSQIDPAAAPRVVREYLDTLDEAAFGAASEVQPKFTSHSDPGTDRQGARQIPRLATDLSGVPIETEMLPECRCQIDHPRRTRRRPPGRQGYLEGQAIRLLDEASQKRSRCSSPTSSAFWAWVGCDYEVHVAQMTNSCSQPPPRTSGNWQRSFPHRSKRAKPDQRGACALFRPSLYAQATRCFSTESAVSGPSLRYLATSPRVKKRSFAELFRREIKTLIGEAEPGPFLRSVRLLHLRGEPQLAVISGPNG